MEYIEGWRYRNGGMLSDNSPHLEANLKPIEDGSIWKHPNKPMVARWTSDFDCGYETEWYYVIKDEPFDLSSLKANHRKNITRGNRHFEVKVIDPKEYIDELYEVATAAYESYPKEYRPHISYETFKGWIDDSEESGIKQVTFGAFSLEDGKLCGNMSIDELDGYGRGAALKAIPAYEKFYLNDAILYGMLEYYKDKLAEGYYIDLGERNIQHKTAIQDKLIRQYGFRKAYCKLNLAYPPIIGFIVKIIYPFRRLLKKLDTVHPLFHKVNGVLAMEEIARACKKQHKAA